MRQTHTLGDQFPGTVDIVQWFEEEVFNDAYTSVLNGYTANSIVNTKKISTRSPVLGDLIVSNEVRFSYQTNIDEEEEHVEGLCQFPNLAWIIVSRVTWICHILGDSHE